MSKFEVQNAEDKELFELFKNRPAQELDMRKIVATEYADVDLDDPEVETRVELVKHIGCVAGRASVGLVFLGAISYGWAEPAFGLIGAAVFFIWAWVYSRRR